MSEDAGEEARSYRPQLVIEVAFDRIRKAYGSVVAVDDVSFDVRAGEIFGLLGPNGAGKTTLIRALMDVIPPDEGQVRLFGRPLERSLLDDVGYLPEENGLYQKQRVADVMAYFGRLKGFSRRDARERAHRWLERLDLEHAARWTVERLSKGMRQKVSVACSLIGDPRVAVLDEPFTGLDPVNVKLVLDLIRERQRAGRTTILSTHRMALVESLCGRVALVDHGRLLVYDELANLRRRYTQPAVSVACPTTPPRVAGVDEISADGNGRFHLRLEPGGDESTVLRSLVAAGVEVSAFEPLLASMEEIFIEVVAAEEPRS